MPGLDDSIEISLGPQEPEDDRPSEIEIRQPFDPTKIRVQTETKTIDNLVSRMRHDEIQLQPDFQRGEVWSDAARSRLIESILIRIPLPAFYMDATDDDRWIVIDGQQRLSTLRRFIIEDSLPLHNLEFLIELNGKTFKDLPQSLKRRINETNVTVYLVEQGTPPAVKFNIFRRINTGGMPLSPQEIRHALNQGVATELLKELALSDTFLTATCRSVPAHRMSDRECVLRCLAFCLTVPENYSEPEFDAFLSSAMGKINEMPAPQIELLRERFYRAMDRSWRLFGIYAFRKRFSPTGSRYPINKALFEAWSVNLEALTDGDFDCLLSRKDFLVMRFIQLMNDASFNNAVSQGTGDYAKVRIRFDEVKRIIRETLDAQ